MLFENFLNYCFVNVVELFWVVNIIVVVLFYFWWFFSFFGGMVIFFSGLLVEMFWWLKIWLMGDYFFIMLSYGFEVFVIL